MGAAKVWVMPRHLPTLLVAVLAALSGCAMAGPIDSDGLALDGKADDVSSGAAISPVLAPAYAMTVTSHVLMAMPDGSDEVTFDSRIEGYMVPVATDDGLTLELTPCHVELPEADGKKPTLADETVQGRGTIVLPAIFSQDIGGEVTLATETGALELGVSLANPLSDDLPADDGDDRLVDHDDDDEIGVTIDVEGWEIYLAARARVWLSGQIDSETGVIAGDAELSIDLQIYGDDIPFVDVRGRVEASNEDEEREIVEVENGFELRPLEAAPSSCAVPGA